MAKVKKPTFPNRDSRQDLKKELGKGLLGVILTAAATIFGTSVVTLYHSRSRLDGITRTYKAHLIEVGGQLPVGLQYLKAASAAGRRSNDRLKGFNSVWTSAQWLSDPDHRNRLRRVAMQAQGEASEDLGKLAAFTPAMTGLAPSYLDAIQGQFRAEIDFWSSVNDLADSTGSTAAEERAFDLWTERTAAALAADSRASQTAQLTMTNWLRQRQDSEKARFDHFQEQMNSWSRTNYLATAGLVLSGAVLVALAALAIF